MKTLVTGNLLLAAVVCNEILLLGKVCQFFFLTTEKENNDYRAP